MIIQDAPKLEARIRKKCGLEAGNNPHHSNNENSEDHDEEGQGLLSAADICERDIDLALVETAKTEEKEDTYGDELDERL